MGKAKTVSAGGPFEGGSAVVSGTAITTNGAGGTRSHLSVGQLALGAELSTVLILVGVGTFDGGTINILYE